MAYDPYIRIRRSWFNMLHYRGRKPFEIYHEWQVYENFEAWSLSNGWVDGYRFTRIDKNKGFTPDNCEWLPKYSARHRRVRCFVKKFCYGRPAVQVAVDNGISIAAFRSRIFRGWTLEEAATVPMMKSYIDFQ